MSDPLANPIWSALTTEHRSFARSNGLAARYPAEVARFAALAEPTPAAFSDLAALVEPGELVGLFAAAPLDVPAGWTVARARPIEQMVSVEPLPPAGPSALCTLEADDAAEMLALTAATEPGPFFERTCEMGRYLGIRAGGRLVAMAGERLRLSGFTEVSAVCTYPEFQGRGYARDLVVTLAADALAHGRRPFLHVKSENGARRLYERLGFRHSRVIHLALLTPGDARHTESA